MAFGTDGNMDAEKWKPVLGFEGRYEVSDLGRVRSLITSKIMRLALSNCGYLRVGLTSSPKQQIGRTVHSLVAEAFIGPRPDGLVVNHKDTNKHNNASSNLEYVTPQENTAHARANGCAPKVYRGADNFRAKLTEVQVSEIRRIAKVRNVGGHVPQVLSDAAIGRLCGVSRMTIWLIVRGVKYPGVEAATSLNVHNEATA